jgi:hypothetical protein
MPAAGQGGDGLLKSLDESSLYELSRFENGGDGALLILADPWFCKANQSHIILPARPRKRPDCGRRPLSTP